MTVFPYVKTAVAQNLSAIFLVMGVSMLAPTFLYDLWGFITKPYSAYVFITLFAMGNYICLAFFLKPLPVYFLKQVSFEGLFFLALISITSVMESEGYLGTAEMQCMGILFAVRLSVISFYLHSKVEYDK